MFFDVCSFLFVFVRFLSLETVQNKNKSKKN